MSFKIPHSSVEPQDATPMTKPSIVKAQSKVWRFSFLVVLLLMSFITLIVGVIFANCVALPHTNYSPEQSSASDTPTTVLGYLRRTVDPDLTASEKEEYTSRGALAALFFYTATLPCLTMMHSSTELLVLLVRPETVSHTSGKAKMQKLLPVLSLGASALLLLGWIPMTTVWIECELRPSTSSSSSICPVQVRGHHMKGLDEGSQAKIALACFILATYIGYTAYSTFRLRVTRKMNGNLLFNHNVHGVPMEVQVEERNV